MNIFIFNLFNVMYMPLISMFNISRVALEEYNIQYKILYVY
jgi:hypothetical protein